MSQTDRPPILKLAMAALPTRTMCKDIQKINLSQTDKPPFFKIGDGCVAQKTMFKCECLRDGSWRMRTTRGLCKGFVRRAMDGGAHYTDVIIGILNQILFNNTCKNLAPHWQCGANRVRVRLAGVTKCGKCGAQNEFEMPQSLTNVVCSRALGVFRLTDCQIKSKLRRAFREHALASHPDKVP